MRDRVLVRAVHELPLPLQQGLIHANGVGWVAPITPRQNVDVTSVSRREILRTSRPVVPAETEFIPRNRQAGMTRQKSAVPTRQPGTVGMVQVN